jgi:hypothetical protein
LKAALPVDEVDHEIPPDPVDDDLPDFDGLG